MICGYAKEPIGQSGELVMKEVSFGFPPEALRDIAKFLERTADEMEKGEPKRLYWHRHIDSVIRRWRERYPDTDIVVVDLRTYPESNEV